VANQQVMKAWVKALRSGEYKQTTGALRRSSSTETMPEGYCCLGVLCDIAIKQPELSDAKLPTLAWEAPRLDGSGLADYLTWPRMADPTDLHHESAMPPHNIAMWAGLDDGNDWGVAADIAGPDLDETNYGSDGRVSLAALNDSEGWTFEQIADAIEKEYIDA
jgi:hypothetical protein